jgi:hypothetical protein
MDHGGRQLVFVPPLPTKTRASACREELCLGPCLRLLAGPRLTASCCKDETTANLRGLCYSNKYPSSLTLSRSAPYNVPNATGSGDRVFESVGVEGSGVRAHCCYPPTTRTCAALFNKNPHPLASPFHPSMRLGNTTTRSPPSAHRAHCLVRASLPQQLVFHSFFE